MENHPAKLLFERNTQLPGVIPHPVQTDIDFTTNTRSRLRQIKAEDIRISIMLQETPVHLPKPVIRTENVLYPLQRFFFFVEQAFDACFDCCFADDVQIAICIAEKDFGHRDCIPPNFVTKCYSTGLPLTLNMRFYATIVRTGGGRKGGNSFF